MKETQDIMLKIKDMATETYPYMANMLDSVKQSIDHKRCAYENGAIEALKLMKEMDKNPDRIEVIADYPYSPYEIGDVLELQSNEQEPEVFFYYNVDGKNKIGISKGDVERWPGIFKKVGCDIIDSEENEGKWTSASMEDLWDAARAKKNGHYVYPDDPWKALKMFKTDNPPVYDLGRDMLLVGVPAGIKNYKMLMNKLFYTFSGHEIDMCYASHCIHLGDMGNGYTVIVDSNNPKDFVSELFPGVSARINGQGLYYIVDLYPLLYLTDPDCGFANEESAWSSACDKTLYTYRIKRGIIVKKS